MVEMQGIRSKLTMADKEPGQHVDGQQLGEDVRQLGHGTEQIEVPPPLIHVGNACFRYQAGLCKVEPPGHEPDVDIPFNVPQNVPFQCASVPPPLMYVGNFKETIEKLVQEQVDCVRLLRRADGEGHRLVLCRVVGQHYGDFFKWFLNND
ncbi:hypothetical protein DAPPUDRAFT_272188 [Daphnia pulex]|uniref:Uncharacterized protein n=1 Tax=Daphnia pulex TaxID=6669 RepID=E9I2U0_DAPPU|nr:hypothetical protein DAPPUDRAFT_272188 [Daphnia pulex]|eukprot:EFX61690.1 hypothetical protein DAPPUDRAFT_272188 [Daphnia pulex]